jgi:hypothetical protein
VIGTTHRLSTPSHRRQCGEEMLRTFVTPESPVLSSRTPSGALRTIGAA